VSFPGTGNKRMDVFFTTTDGIRISGRLDGPDSGPSVVITHPHPLYGGDMDNQVVSTIARAYRKAGYTTLCFNFRGVGKSEGNHTGGPGEKKDLVAAIAFLSDSVSGPIVLAGYSYGAWINATAGPFDNVASMVMVSPPVSFDGISFDKVSSLFRLELVVTGSRDEIAQAGAIRSMLPKWNKDARLEIIEGADHFYSYSLEKLYEVLSDHAGGENRKNIGV